MSTTTQPTRLRAMSLAALAAALLLASATPSPAAPEVLRSGSLTGVSGHTSSGSIEIVKDGDVTKVVFKGDFVLKDAPDPTLAWGKDGFKRGTFFGKLKTLKGAQEYVIPAGTDLSRFNEFWLWCQRYDVALAMAKLK